MSFAEHCWQRFNVFALAVLLGVLIICHVFMMHYGRPVEMIRWLEGLIGGVVNALMLLLGMSKKSEGEK